MAFTVSGRTIVEIDAWADPARVSRIAAPFVADVVLRGG
jgi:hypothetical protein